MEGTIKYFNESRGFGFISCAGAKKDVFFHVSGYLGEFVPEKGERVTFETRPTEKGPLAYQVVPAA